MSKSTFELQTSDKVKVHGNHWQTENPKAVICLVHGFGEHVDRYDHFAAWFNPKGYAIIGTDRRGHGKSGGQRGHTPSYKHYLDEIDLIIAEADKHYPNLPKIIYGHSAGGNHSLNYVIDRKPGAKCVVVTGPWIKLAFEAPKALVMLGKVMRKVYPKFSNNNQLDASLVCRDEAVVKKYVGDPLVHDKVSAEAGLAMMDAGNKLAGFKGTMPIPTLVMHGGDDQVTSMPASVDFCKNAKGDVTCKIWEGFYHEIHNEKEQNEVFQFTYDWIESKL